MSERMNDQPQMYGERIWLRPIELRDALALSQSTGTDTDSVDPGAMVPVGETAFRAWIQSLDETELVWAICRNDEQEAIGTASIRRIDLHHRTAETGMGLLHANDRGIGLGQEVKHLILDFAFNVMGLHAVNCTIDARNIRSQKSVEKSGYRLAGSLTANTPLGLGKYADTLVYQLLAADWIALQRENASTE